MRVWIPLTTDKTNGKLVRLPRRPENWSDVAAAIPSAPGLGGFSLDGDQPGRQSGVMSDVTFEEFAPSELASWLERTKSGYIAERVASGDSVAEATANADASIAQTFPGGSPGPGHLAGWISHEGLRVGELWIGPFADDNERWWVWNVEIDAAQRGKGLGRKAMVLAETLASAHRANSIGLNVFAQNRIARNLYKSLGYEESSVQMRKAIAPST